MHDIPIAKTMIIWTLLTLCFQTQAERAVFDSLRHELNSTTVISEQIPVEIQLAHHYIYINKDSLRHYASLAVNHSKQIKDYGHLWRAYLKYSMYFNAFPDSKNDQMAFAYIDSARLVATEHNMSLGVATCYFQSGYLKMELNKDQAAITDLTKAKAMYQELGHSAAIIQISYQIGNLYLKTGNPQKAIQIFKTIADNPQLTTSFLYCAFLECFGNAYQSIGDYESALSRYKKCYSLIQQEGDNCDKNRILMKLTAAFNKLGIKDSTQHYFNQAENYIDSCQQNEALDNNYRLLAEVCISQKNYQKAEYYYQKSLDVVRQNNWSSDELETLKGLAHLYEQKEDFHKAYDYYQQYAQLKDSLKLLGLDQVLSQVMKNEELNEKSGELVQLLEERKAMVKKIVILSFFAVVTALLFLVFWFYQGKMLYNFCNHGLDKKSKRSQQLRFHQFRIPTEVPSTLIQMLIAALFAAVIALSSLFILNMLASSTNLILWIFITYIVYFISHWPYHRYKFKHKEISFSRVLFWRLTIIFINSAVLTTLALIFRLTSTEFDNILMVSLTLISGQFIVNTLELLVKYRQSFDLVKNHMINDFNQLITQKNAQEKQKTKNAPLTDTIQNSFTIEGKKINLANVMYISSENVYQEFVQFIEGKESKTLTRSTLKSIEQELNSHPQFVRCHRSYIINTEHIQSITGNSRQQYLKLSHSDTKIPISRSLDMQIIKHLEEVVIGDQAQ